MSKVYKTKFQRTCRLCKVLFTTPLEKQKYCDECNEKGIFERKLIRKK